MDEISHRIERTNLILKILNENLKKMKESFEHWGKDNIDNKFEEALFYLRQLGKEIVIDCWTEVPYTGSPRFNNLYNHKFYIYTSEHTWFLYTK